MLPSIIDSSPHQSFVPGWIAPHKKNTATQEFGRSLRQILVS